MPRLKRYCRGSSSESSIAWPKSTFDNSPKPSEPPIDHTVVRLWFLDNLAYPYPTAQQKDFLAKTAGIQRSQVDSDLTNYRRRAGWTDIMNVWCGGDRNAMKKLMNRVEKGKEQRKKILDAVQGCRDYLTMKENNKVGDWIKEVSVLILIFRSSHYFGFPCRLPRPSANKPHRSPRTPPSNTVSLDLSPTYQPPLHALAFDPALPVPSPVVVPPLAHLLAPKSPRLLPSSLFLERGVTPATSPFLPSNVFKVRLLRSLVHTNLGPSPTCSLCLLLPVPPKRTSITSLSPPPLTLSVQLLSHYLHLPNLLPSRA